MVAKLIIMTALCALTCREIALAQAAPVTILRIDLENWVPYFYDVFDLSKLATDPNATTAAPARNFRSFIGIADIVAVNGKPAKGALVARRTQIFLTTSPTPGQAIADTVRQAIEDASIEILQSDGTAVGSIFVNGLTMGSPPPGAPLASSSYNIAIVGGTGAYLGMRGQETVPAITGTTRPASVTEDPSRRRINRGLNLQILLHLIPMSRPEIVATPNGPVVVHASNFSPVTAANPAKSGEVLSLIATGLGPTRPGVDPGQPFTADPLQVVNSPIEMTVNGVLVEVLYAGGYPGTTNTYQVNFRLPAGVPPGLAAIQISSAWIVSPEVGIAVH
jgi:hypothetical protein